MFSIIVSLFFLLNPLISSSNSLKLERVVLVFRHGHRTPELNLYPTHEKFNQLPPEYYGTLTEVSLSLKKIICN